MIPKLIPECQSNTERVSQSFNHILTLLANVSVNDMLILMITVNLCKCLFGCDKPYIISLPQLNSYFKSEMLLYS